MINEAEIAYKLLGFQSSTSSVLMAGELQEALGSDGYGYALERGWIRPDYDQGMILINETFECLLELREKAKGYTNKPIKVTESEAKVKNVYRMFSTLVDPSSITESSVMRDTRSLVEDKYEVGEEVLIADDGKTLKGVVKTLNPDGTFELSFPENAKPRTTKPYKSDELKKTKTVPTTAGGTFAFTQTPH